MRSFFPWRRAYLNSLLAKCDIQEAMVINLYMADPNGDKKAIAEKLGISKLLVTNILKRPHVQKYRLLIQQEMFKEMGKTAEEITADLVEIQETAMGKRPVIGENGQPSDKYMVDYKIALESVEKQARHIGYYEKDNEQQGARVAPVVVMFGEQQQAKAIESAQPPVEPDHQIEEATNGTDPTPTV